MRWRTLVVYTVGGVVLAFLYYWLVAELVGYSAAVPRPGWWMNLAPTIGRRAAGLVWSEILNTVAMCTAALAAGWAAVLMFRSHALAVVVIAATAAAAYGLGETSGVLSTSHMRVGTGFTVLLMADSFKIAILPTVLVTLLRFSPSGLRGSRT